MKTIIALLVLISLISCSASDPNAKKIIDTGAFEIEVPQEWKYVKASGIDSFVGSIEDEERIVHFDWSEMGYANSLHPTIQEYLISGEWAFMIHPAYMKDGISYTSGDIASEKSRLMLAKRTKDTANIKVEKIQIPKRKVTFIEGKYKGILIYEDTTQVVDIAIPEIIQQHEFELDTIGRYYRKIIKPKNGTTGITGVFFQDLRSGFNFNIVGRDLSMKNQTLVVEAIKTIVIKRN